MEKLIEALRETLAKLGLDEGAIEAALQEAVDKASAEEDPQPSGDPVPPTDASDVPPLPPEEPVDETPSVVPPSADLPVEEAQVPPTEEEVPPTGDVPPAEPAPVAPPFDPTALLNQVTTLQSQLDEQIKANNGLVERVQALEDALKKAGVIDGNNPTTTVGDELPSAAPQNPTEDVLGSVLSELNGHKRF